MKTATETVALAKCHTPPTNTLVMRLLEQLHQFEPDRLNELYDLHATEGVPFDRWAIQHGLIDERQVAQAYASHYLLPFFDPPCDTPPPIHPSVGKILPPHLCCENLIAPLNDDGQTIEVALVSPDSLLLADEVRLLTGRQMRPFFTTQSVIQRLLDLLYPDAGVTVQTETQEANESAVDDSAADWVAGFREVDDENVQQYVTALFEQALRVNASEIHIEPCENDCRVRFRVERALQELPTRSTATPPANAVLKRIKTLSKMKDVDGDLPQEGVIRIRSNDRRVVVRVTTCPTLHGEKVMMRIGRNSTVVREIKHLGLSKRQLHDLTETLHGPDRVSDRGTEGMILVAGPPASGRSTTLYGCLQERNASESNCYTVEKKVAFRVDGLNQIQTSDRLGMTYAEAIRSCMRQDPDVIMVGELTDPETAQLCARVASTGRLVLSTVPSTEALGCVAQVRARGVSSTDLSRNLRLLVAQRLVHRLCDACKAPSQIDSQLASQYEIDPHAVIYEPSGCQQCRFTGFVGQTAIFEVIPVDDLLADAIQHDEPIEGLREAAIRSGAILLPQAAVAKLIAGKTSQQEVCRVLPDRSNSGEGWLSR